MFNKELSIAYTIIPLILISVVLAAVWLERWSVPVIVVAMGIGILFGSDVLNAIHFNDAELTKKVADLALVLILFHGGFVTKRSDFRSVALPAGGLATWGVILTALFTLLTLWKVLGWDFQLACLLAVIISSTDAAAIFATMRRQSLSPRISTLVEVESAANDPMAILLTVIAVQFFAEQKSGVPSLPLTFFWKFIIGPVIGWLMARGAVAVFNWLAPQERGHYYILYLSVALLTYGLAEAYQASGIMAVFIAGYTMGNHSFIHKQGIAGFSAALSTVANVGLFILMGLLVDPHRWGTLWPKGLTLFLVLTFIGRPLAVAVSTIGMRLKTSEKIFTMWAGLRGSVPVVLATYPAASGLDKDHTIFSLVFFAVFLSILLQGSTLGIFARWLRLTTTKRPKRLYELELITMAKSDMNLFEVDLPGPQGCEGPRIQDLKLPEHAVITMISRGPEVVSPRGQTRLNGWDHVTVLAHAKDERAVLHALRSPFMQD